MNPPPEETLGMKDDAKDMMEQSPSPARKRTKMQSFERRKRRRRLRRMLTQAGEFPSFVALISSVEEDEEDTKMEEEPEKDRSPDVIYIDVDEYLGLEDKKETQLEEAPASLSRRGNHPAFRAEHAKSATPQEEGFYTGRVPVAMTDSDSLYLSTLQQLIRNNLEFFSASRRDASKSQTGRRYPIVEGKVGVRCIHCAKVSLEYEAEMERKMD